MKTYLICIISCILCSISINAQEKVFLDLDGKPIMVEGYSSLELRGPLKGLTYADFRALLNEDIFSYYGLEDYETPLLKEEFLNSSEGEKLAMQLSKLKKSICSDDIYYIFPFYNNKGWKKEYNLSTGAFDFEYIISDYIPISGYINFSYSILKTSKIQQSVVQTEWYNYPGRYYYHITLKIPMPKTTALLIEKNIDDAALVVSFNSPQTKSTAVTGVITNVMIINIKTSEIYYSLDKNKLKELQIKQDNEHQAKLAQERERQRKIEEQQQKELEEAKRKATERRATIDAFLAERADTVYSARITDRLQYNHNNTSLSEAVASAVEYFNPQNLELSVSDSLYIDYKGNKRHSMQISSSPELPGLADAIKKNIEQCPLSPFKLNIPGTDTTCTVNSSDLYSLGYSTETESAVLRLKKVKNSTYLKSGDSQFYQNYKYGLANYLAEGDGIYEINATVKTTNGRRTTDVTINGFRDLSPSFMMSYNYTPFAPTGVALGINNIKSSNWGAFIKMGFLGTSVIQGSPTKISNVNEIPENLLDTYGSFYLTLGTTCSFTSYGFLYAGIGIANKNWSINSSRIKTTGFNIEAGVIIRPIEWVGVSIGYNYIAGKNPFGGVNIGAVLFI